MGAFSVKFYFLIESIAFRDKFSLSNQSNGGRTFPLQSEKLNFIICHVYDRLAGIRQISDSGFHQHINFKVAPYGESVSTKFTRGKHSI